MSALKLAIFDVDGTLVDSDAHIAAAMAETFAACDLVPPDRAAVRRVIGLSLPQAVAQLAPDLAPPRIDALVDGYKTAYVRLRDTMADASPLFPGIADLLARLSRRDDLLLGVATGKSRRGLDAVLGLHDLSGYFVTLQVADDHPSKPHPAMLQAALAETGAASADAVMVGDTTFDLQMAHNARIRALAVGWGYHDPAALAAEGPAGLVHDVPALDAALMDMLELAA
jgi:phosphoglycolate phosphatase